MTGNTVGMHSAADRDRQRRRVEFLRELAEAKALRERVHPRRARRARAARLHYMLTFRQC
jgi:hypothetical protein